MTDLDALQADYAAAQRLILALAEKLWIVAKHLERLAEKRTSTATVDAPPRNG